MILSSLSLYYDVRLLQVSMSNALMPTTSVWLPFGTDVGANNICFTVWDVMMGGQDKIVASTFSSCWRNPCKIRPRRCAVTNDDLLEGLLDGSVE
jgi:hypothetical protein